MIRRICFFIIFICSICFLFSCSGDTGTNLNLPISEDTMANIIRDMQKANYMIMTLEKDSLQTVQMKADYKQSICNHYNTNPQTYDSCLRVYLQHEDIMKEILEKAK